MTYLSYYDELYDIYLSISIYIILIYSTAQHSRLHLYIYIIQNNAARLIFRTTRFAHDTPMLHSLHWLPIEQKIKYKLSLLCFKIISHQAPIYLSELLHLYTPSWHLRSSTDSRVFRIPSFRTKSCGQCSFSYQAPVNWNQLPVSVHHSTSVSSFISSLKIFLFLKTVSSVPLA